MSTTIQTIKLSCRDDARIEVPAVVTGNWAAHGALLYGTEPSDAVWTVSYVPLGLEVGSAMSRCAPAVAVQVAAALNSEVPEVTLGSNGVLEEGCANRIQDVIKTIGRTMVASDSGERPPRDRLTQLRSAVANGQRLNEDGTLLRRVLLALIDEALR